MMDWDSRNALGVTPLKEMTDAVEAISTGDELMDYFVETPPEKQAGSLWSGGATQDLLDSDRYILAVGDAGLLLEDSAEYREITPYGTMMKDAYTALANKMLLKLGYSPEESRQKIDNSFAFETMMADTIYSSEEQQRPDFYARIYNIFTREELEALQGRLPVLDCLEKTMGYPAAEEYLVMNPAFFESLNELCSEENLPLIRDMFIVNVNFLKIGNYSFNSLAVCPALHPCRNEACEVLNPSSLWDGRLWTWLPIVEQLRLMLPA